MAEKNWHLSRPAKEWQCTQLGVQAKEGPHMMHLICLRTICKQDKDPRFSPLDTITWYTPGDHLNDIAICDMCRYLYSCVPPCA